MENIIAMRGIIKRFYIGQPNELEILHGIDLDGAEGEFVSIVGASGSGKSTLMNLIGVLDRATGGSYTPVSYTHLDVYKRQGLKRKRLSPSALRLKFRWRSFFFCPSALFRPDA